MVKPKWHIAQNGKTKKGQNDKTKMAKWQQRVDHAGCPSYLPSGGTQRGWLNITKQYISWM